MCQVKPGADGTILCLDPDPGSMAERTAAVAVTLGALRDQGHITGWRDELYPVVGARFSDAPALLVERAAAPMLGVKAYGVHMNGFVRKADGMYLWVATRSDLKPTWPGKLDHIAAGGQVRIQRAELRARPYTHGNRSALADCSQHISFHNQFSPRWTNLVP